MKRIIVTYLLVLSVSALLGQQGLPSETQLSLSISATSQEYVEGAPLTIKFTFRNIGKKSTTFILPHKDEDHPGYITARVWDERNVLVTQNDVLENGWWTSWVLSSQQMKEKKSDQISLKSGGAFTRTLDLARILSGCRCLPKGLRPGTYRIQLSFKTEVISNEIKLRIRN
jgi:hypothetical protein